VTTRAFVVGRRRKGRHIGRIVREVRAMLEAAGWTVESELVDRRSELIRETRQAVARGVDVAVAVGGDGAVHQVVTAVAGTSAALGIIPAGTGNLLAGNLGIPHDIPKAAEVILSGEHRRIDLGRATVGGRTFDVAVACGVGFDADVMNATGNAAKRSWGKLAYFASAATNSGRIRNIRHDITLDGVTMHTKAAQVFVANFGRMGPGLAPRRAVVPDDGLLEVVVVRASGAIPALGAAWEALRRTELGEAPSGRVFRGQATRVRIATSRPRLVEVDGNVVGHTPVEVRVVPASLVVIVPGSE
jgi:diacylglycerol kinase (ATP)